MMLRPYSNFSAGLNFVSDVNCRGGIFTYTNSDETGNHVSRNQEMLDFGFYSLFDLIRDDCAF